jgi:hypothetical protein
VRDREHPENDEMFVRQTTFWNLRARNVEPLFGLAAALELAEFATLAVLPLGAGGLALGTALLAPKPPSPKSSSTTSTTSLPPLSYRRILERLRPVFPLARTRGLGLSYQT